MSWEDSTGATMRTYMNHRHQALTCSYHRTFPQCHGCAGRPDTHGPACQELQEELRIERQHQHEKEVASIQANHSSGDRGMLGTFGLFGLFGLWD